MALALTYARHPYAVRRWIANGIYRFRVGLSGRPKLHSGRPRPHSGVGNGSDKEYAAEGGGQDRRLHTGKEHPAL